MNRLRTLGTALLMAFALQAGAAQVWVGTATRITDGDSLWVRPAAGGKPVQIRIDGIDAPEICQAGGQAARKALVGRLRGRRLEMVARRKDDYGRTLAAVHVAGEDVGGWMVSQGYAWSYRYGRDGGPYVKQQALAQSRARGVFADHAAVEPRDFRRKHGSCHSQRHRP